VALRAFEAEGFDGLLLKGASLARWLYDETQIKEATRTLRGDGE
jgi:hypothetical protein